MKKIAIVFLLLMCTVISYGCGAKQTSAKAEAVPGTEFPVVTEPEAETEPETETEPVILEGNLYIKVSSITFSLVGESDDVYLGLIPRELVCWESENPNVVSVKNGVLTATGVGTTLIHASYADREVSFAAGCLAETQEKLDELPAEVLSAPKRLPPEVDLDEPCTLFDDSAILGDSITYFLWQYESENHNLGGMTFVSRHGISVNSLVNRSKNMYFEGHEMYIDDIIAKLDASQIYILLGCLDFQVPPQRETLMEHWNQLLDLIAEKAPEKEIVLISNIPSFTKRPEQTTFNEAVAKTTPQLRQLAADRGYGFLDLGYYIQDHYGRLPAVYCKDEFHMNDEGSLAWTKILRFYAQYEREGGSLC